MPLSISFFFKPIFLGPLLSVILFFYSTSHGLPSEQGYTLAITFLCAVWWVFEPIPIPATSLIPIALLPLFAVLTPAQVGAAYGSPLILLLLGGFILSTAMEKTNTHKRLAYGMVNLFGSSKTDSSSTKNPERKMVFGFMIASATLSMWISNTATTLMLLPVAIAIINQTGKQSALAKPLLLGIAYAASIGGMGTPIGTPPNLILMQSLKENGLPEIGFFTWMSWSLPIIIIMLPLCGFWLTRNLNSNSSAQQLNLTPENLGLKLGPWRNEEKRLLTLFLLTALAWIFRKEPFGGWSTWLNIPQINDASVVLISCVFLFIIPSGEKNSDGQHEKILNWKTASNIPWGTLLLFSGGITIAKAFTASGLSSTIGQTLSSFSQWPPIIIILLLTISITFLTEVTSNTATTTLLMPILAATAIENNLNPLLLMVPATISASCAFMLPVATAPNAIVFSSNKISIKTMVREGLILNFIGILIITTISYWFFT